MSVNVMIRERITEICDKEINHIREQMLLGKKSLSEPDFDILISRLLEQAYLKSAVQLIKPEAVEEKE